MRFSIQGLLSILSRHPRGAEVPLGRNELVTLRGASENEKTFSITRVKEGRTDIGGEGVAGSAHEAIMTSFIANLYSFNTAHEITDSDLEEVKRSMKKVDRLKEMLGEQKFEVMVNKTVSAVKEVMEQREEADGSDLTVSCRVSENTVQMIIEEIS